MPRARLSSLHLRLATGAYSHVWCVTNDNEGEHNKASPRRGSRRNAICTTQNVPRKRIALRIALVSKNRRKVTRIERRETERCAHYEYDILYIYVYI